MTWRIPTYLNLKRKPLSIFLIAFSVFTLAATGIIWACADSDEHDFSMFAPEYFVNKQYSPFFYSSNEVYYNLQYGPTSNERYNDIITDEWYKYFDKRFSRKSILYLLTKASEGAIDSVYRNYSGSVKILPKNYPDSNREAVKPKQLAAFFNYLKLAKSCEHFTVSPEEYSWGYEKVKPQYAAAQLEPALVNKFKNETDAFIKERLWFQLVRYYYFRADSAANIKSVQVFDQYKNKFPQSITYYRAMGYVAGYYYHQKNYALANYLYSLCYNYSSDLKIPSFWSFHPQNETDWMATLQLAKTNDEKITLWQMLGIYFDEARAIKEIVAINPKTEKLDVLLGRFINLYEHPPYNEPGIQQADSSKKAAINGRKLIETIALKNNTAKPYFWNLAAGYLNYMDSNYTAAARYYAIAKKQMPKGDTLIMAQSKLLDILLYVKQLKAINAAAEQKLTEPLNWLADMRDSKRTVKDLRFGDAMGVYTQDIAQLYRKQHIRVNEVCFDDSASFYVDNKRIDQLISLLNKPGKTPFEKAMVRYYPHTVNDLYYHQAVNLVYADKTREAITLLKKRPLKDFELYANPFNSRLNDCHDCDAEAPQKQKFTPLLFAQTLQNMKTELATGKNIYRNAYLVASAYYNITYYGNGRLFYESDVISSGNTYTYDNNGDKQVFSPYVSMANAEKYYRMALNNATTNDQKARCTFMLSKCALNNIYNTTPDVAKPAKETSSKYYALFDELKHKYSQTAYYKEVLKECGYFRDYITANK